MARGWESKGVEGQQQEAERDRALAGRRARTPEEIERDTQRQGLQLSRARTLSSLQTACHPSHRALLERTLAHIDGELRELDNPGSVTSDK